MLHVDPTVWVDWVLGFVRRGEGRWRRRGREERWGKKGRREREVRGEDRGEEWGEGGCNSVVYIWC